MLLDYADATSLLSDRLLWHRREVRYLFEDLNKLNTDYVEKFSQLNEAIKRADDFKSSCNIAKVDLNEVAYNEELDNLLKNFPAVIVNNPNLEHPLAIAIKQLKNAFGIKERD